MVAMGLKNVRKFPFIEPPSEESIDHSLVYLIEQSALDDKEELTAMGRLLAELPVDVQIGKMLIMASIFHVVEPIITMAAALSVQSAFVSNLKCDFETMQARKQFINDHGDPLTLLNAYNEWIQVKTSHVNSFKWCKRRGLEEQRFYEISKLKKQFYELLQENHLLKKRAEDESDDEDSDDFVDSQDEESNDKKPRSSYNEKLKKNYQKLLEKKERKRLLAIKKELINKPKRPKLLNLDEYDVDTSNLDQDQESDYQDIRDIEFQLMNNLNELQNKSLSCKKYTLREVNLLKIILTCGLYPQIAISDEFNNYKRDSDQCFHSKHKAFVVLHPTSIFAYDPDILQPVDDGIVKDKLKYSTRHQLLVYVNLFETNKPYFMNCMRVPAAQTLLLYARSLDTNDHCTRIICDEWIELRFLDAELAQKLLSSVLYLRASIERLFKTRLDDRLSVFKREECELGDLDQEEKEVKESGEEIHERARALERLLKKKLSEFLDSSVLYAMRRVLPAELPTVYIKNFVKEEENSAKTSEEAKKNDETTTKQSEVLNSDLQKLIAKSAKMNEAKGGYKITNYLTYNCLVSEATMSIVSEFSGLMKRHWKCPICLNDFVFDLRERMEHEVECQLKSENESISSDKAKKCQVPANETEYHCPICDKKFFMTAIDVLKHKRSHL